MLTIGNLFPSFALKAVTNSENTLDFPIVDSQTLMPQWQVYFFWPKDFTFVCPTEIAEFGKLQPAFADRDAQLFGVSTDSEFVHLAWKQQKAELTHLPFPLLSDIKRDLCHALGIIEPAEGVAQRAIFIVDPNNIIRFVMVTDARVGRNPQEVLRVLEALQTEELCPCNWQPGQQTLAIN